MNKLEQEFVFKNKDFRKRCTTVMKIAAVLAGVYVLLGLINLQFCQNYPRFILRLVITVFYAVELCLFAERNSVYIEIGGDYALARRSGAALIIAMIINSIVEAYYVSVFLSLSGTPRLLYMCAIILIGCAGTLPLILFQYLNFEIGIMRVANVLSVAASVFSFLIGFIIVSVNTIVSYGNGRIFETVGFIFDSFSPVYLINCIVPFITAAIARITFTRQMKINARFAPEAPEGEQEEKEETY